MVKPLDWVFVVSSGRGARITELRSSILRAGATVGVSNRMPTAGGASTGWRLVKRTLTTHQTIALRPNLARKRLHFRWPDRRTCKAGPDGGVLPAHDPAQRSSWSF